MRAHSVMSQCSQIAYATVCHVTSTFGLGKHLIAVEQHPSNLIEVALLCDISEILAIMAYRLGKTSFAVTFLRIFFRKSGWSYCRDL